jgi:hypothetical protein
MTVTMAIEGIVKSVRGIGQNHDEQKRRDNPEILRGDNTKSSCRIFG